MTSVVEFPQEAAIHGEVEAGASAKVRKQLEQLISHLQKSTFDIAELLFEVKDKKFYIPYGFDTLTEYIESLNIKARKAQYLIRIVEVMRAVECERSEYEPLGIAKLREITSLDPDTNYLDPKDKTLIPMRDFIIGFIDEGKGMSLKEIKQHVKTLKGLVGENELVFVHLCFKKSVLEEAWNPAIKKAKANIGSVGRDEDGNAVDASDGRAAEVIAIEYFNNPMNDPIPVTAEGQAEAIEEAVDEALEEAE